MSQHAPHDVLRNGSIVQRCAAIRRDGAQHCGQRRVAQHMAHGMRHWVRRAVGGVEVARRLRIALQIALGTQHRVQSRAHGKALLGQCDGRLQQARPGQSAMRAVGVFEHPHRAGHAHRAAAGDGLAQRHGLAITAQEEVFTRSRGRRLAAVPGLHLRAVPVQHEGATADAAALRLHQREHHLHGHGGVHRGAAGFEHLHASTRCQRMSGGHGVAREGPAGFGRDAAGAFGQGRRAGSVESGARREARAGSERGCDERCATQRCE